MKIVVCVKYVPAASATPTFAADLTTEREANKGVLSELDEYAVEQALRIVESGVVATITYLTMGPAGAAEALHKALSMGGDRAIHVLDPALHGSDAVATSLVLAAALAKAGFDLVLCGMGSTDGAMSVVPAMLAERLGIAQLTLADEIGVANGRLQIRRASDAATEQIEADLPAVASVTDHSGDARYPSFRGIMAARSKPTETWALAELGLSPEVVGLEGAWTRTLSVAHRAARGGGTIVRDEGDGGRQLADFLSRRKFI